MVIPGVEEGAEWHLSLTPRVELPRRTRILSCVPLSSVTVALAARWDRTDGKSLTWLKGFVLFIIFAYFDMINGLYI